MSIRPLAQQVHGRAAGEIDEPGQAAHGRFRRSLGMVGCVIDGGSGFRGRAGPEGDNA